MRNGVSTPTVFMFSGQGSQHYRMAYELFQSSTVFKNEMCEMDEIARDKIGSSIIRELYDRASADREQFTDTVMAHTAIFIVEYALARTLIQAGVDPDYVLGVSMGAFAAAAIAGCLDQQQALDAVVRQGKLIATYCERGGMIAVLGDSSLCQDQLLLSACDLAARNSASHFVFSTLWQSLGRIEEYLKRKEVCFQRLPVSHAFHSRWIEPARQPWTSALKSLPAKSPVIPLICCAEADLDVTAAAEYFWTVIREPIQIEATIHALEERNYYTYVDLGPSSCLATILKRCIPSDSASRVLPVLGAFSGDCTRLQNVVKTLRNQKN
jgi:acyl transferase domain-containing protein